MGMKVRGSKASLSAAFPLLNHSAFTPDIAAVAKVSFPWRGDSAHIGPTHTVNAVMTPLLKLNTCGHQLLAVGVALWGLRHLEPVPRPNVTTSLLQATFAGMTNVATALDVSDYRRDRNSDTRNAAISTIEWFLFGAIHRGRWAENIETPSSEVFHMIYVVRHVLGTSTAIRRAFDGWLKEILGRLNRVSRQPRHRSDQWFEKASDAQLERAYQLYWGRPLPLDLLVEDLPSAEIDARLRGYLASVDWSGNPWVPKAPLWNSWQAPQL